MRKEFVYVENLKDHVGEEVTLGGWLYNKRASGKIWFLILRDGTGVVQGVISKKEVSRRPVARRWRRSAEVPGRLALRQEDSPSRRMALSPSVCPANKSARKSCTSRRTDDRNMPLQSCSNLILSMRHSRVREARAFARERIPSNRSA